MTPVYLATPRGPVVDLFAGPGGWSEAARELGITEVGIEHDASACATRAAAGHLTIRQDVTTLDTARFRPLEGLIASPPCPTFSAAGGRAGIAELRYLIEHVHACTYGGWRPYVPPDDLGVVEVPGACDEILMPDPRSALVLEPLRFALDCCPQWIALEQVPDVLPVWEAYRFVLQALGWSVWCGVLNAADYGVPQTRRRAILMAHRRYEVSPPEPTHCEGGASTLLAELAPWVSMAAALGWGATARCSPTLHAGKTGSGRVYGSAEHGSPLEPSPTLDAKAGQAWMVGEPGHRQALAEVKWGHDRPATTVCADPRLSPPGYRGKPEDYDADGNYGGARSMDDALKLSVSDALKLQSFRADYPVQGTKTKSFEQVGNAIPPLLARHVLAALSAATPMEEK